MRCWSDWSSWSKGAKSKQVLLSRKWSSRGMCPSWHGCYLRRARVESLVDSDERGGDTHSGILHELPGEVESED
jgi:hypothetical protein